MRSEEQEARAIEEFHQRPSQRNAAFRKKNQPPTLLQEFRHSFDGVRRGGIDGKCLAAQHDLAMQPARLSRRTRGDELPIVIQRHVKEKPVEPGHVIRDEQDRPRRLEATFVMDAKTAEQLQEKPEESLDYAHNDSL